MTVCAGAGAELGASHAPKQAMTSSHPSASEEECTGDVAHRGDFLSLLVLLPVD